MAIQLCLFMCYICVMIFVWTCSYTRAKSMLSFDRLSAVDDSDLWTCLCGSFWPAAEDQEAVVIEQAV